MHDKAICPSEERVNCDKTIKTYFYNLFYIFMLHERTFILALPTRKTVGGDDNFYLKFWVKLTLLERKRRSLINIRS